MYFKLGFKGKNDIWRYVLTVFISFLAGQALGSIPYLYVISTAILKTGEATAFENATDFEALGISSTLGLMLVVIPFITGLIGLYIGVKYVHKKKMKDLLTAASGFRYRRMFVAAAIWVLLLAAFNIFHMVLEPENYVFNFNGKQFFFLLVVAFLFLPFQTTYEELLFRGYLMQGIGVATKNRWLPLVLTALFFGSLHFLNPEVNEFGYWTTMPQYIGWGIFLGIIVILDDGLEIAIGTHAANNIFLSLFITHDSAALQTEALFTVKELNAVRDMAEFFLSIVIFLTILQLIYRWKTWKKIFEPFSRPDKEEIS